MSKIAHYLQEHLVGEVMTSVDARNYFAKDSSIFNIPPALIVYPRNENDIRKTTRFSWQLAERNRLLPITSRGSGTDTTGAALGSGLVIVFPAHLHHILELDNKSGEVSVEAGINFGKLQQTLQTHGRYIPAYPSSIEYSTIGGAVANNINGDRSYKYGPIANYIKGLRVVLANGEVIDTERLSKKDLNKKLGLASFEGEIYRSIDTLIEENKELVSKSRLNVTRNNAGYDLIDVKGDDGTFDLTPLFIGSQGTLGIVSEITLDSIPYNPDSTLFMAKIEELETLQNVLDSLRDFKTMPCSVEIVNKGLLNAVHSINPNQFKDVLKTPYPEYLLFVEFDLVNDHQYKKSVKQAQKLFEKMNITFEKETDPDFQQKLIKIREASATYLSHVEGFKKSMPIIQDGVVPPNRLADLISGTIDIFKKVNVNDVSIWGHAGDGNIHIQPQLNLSQVGDRQKAFRLMDDYYDLIIQLGGSISGEHNDGRLKTPYLEKLYGPEVYALMQKVKQVFDPYNILNPGVKFNTSIEDIKNMIAPNFDLGNLYTYLPRS